MADEKNNKKPTLTLEERKKAFTRGVEDLDLKNRLLGSPELFGTDPGTDDFLDTLSLKIKLIGGREFTLEDYLSETLVEYQSHFYQEYYDVIAKLHGLPPEVMHNYAKPQCARDHTLQFVYARFPKKVVDAIMTRSSWSEVPGIRVNKLFQRLSQIATEQLDLFIDQTVAMGNESGNMTEFKKRYSAEYKIYFQLDMFTDIGIDAFPTA